VERGKNRHDDFAKTGFTGQTDLLFDIWQTTVAYPPALNDFVSKVTASLLLV
jgi:hypothetical protein